MTRDEVILTAVQWWSDKLASRAPHSNGDSSSASILACMFADMGAKSITKEQLSVFEHALTEKLQEKYDDLIIKRNIGHMGIGTDYGPTMELSEAAAKAGISTMNFPFKTWMRIYKDYVDVSAGYGAQFVRI